MVNNWMCHDLFDNPIPKISYDNPTPKISYYDELLNLLWNNNQEEIGEAIPSEASLIKLSEKICNLPTESNHTDKPEIVDKPEIKDKPDVLRLRGGGKKG